MSIDIVKEEFLNLFSLDKLSQAEEMINIKEDKTMPFFSRKSPPKRLSLFSIRHPCLSSLPAEQQGCLSFSV
jgi:hypothetical protein